MREALRQLGPLARETLTEAWAHPALLAAIIMRPLGYRWIDHRWDDA